MKGKKKLILLIPVILIAGVLMYRYVKQRILDPLGMGRSTLDVAVAQRDPDRLVPHRKGKSGPEATPFPYPNPEDNPGFSFLSAAGGILSSANEMARYVNDQIEQVELPGAKIEKNRLAAVPGEPGQAVKQ